MQLQTVAYMRKGKFAFENKKKKIKNSKTLNKL